MSLILRSLATAAILGGMTALAVAQATGTNPLRPGARTTQTQAPPQQGQATNAPQTTEDGKPRRQRSAAQLANDNRMRACGQEWRSNKAQLQAQGKTWLTFSTECRARLKAQGR